MSPEELLMEEVPALDITRAANGAGIESNHMVHGCEEFTTVYRLFSLTKIAAFISSLAESQMT